MNGTPLRDAVETRKPGGFAPDPRALKAALLAVVLVVHFLSRQHLVYAKPLTESTNYPFVYRTSLALLAGHGFGLYRISDAPESRPVVEFLNCQREGLTRKEFKQFLNGPDGRPVTYPVPEAAAVFPPGAPGGELKTPVSPWQTSRVLDIYATALLWWVFGIHWSALLTFCALASTCACLMVFLTARRVGGGYWPGLCAAVLYLASPLENDYAISCLRDISPLWFAALAFAVYFCLVERFRSLLANWAALALLGLVCTLGCGWRSDAMLLAPFLGASAAVFLMLRRKNLRYLLVGGAAFVLGALLPVAAIQCLCPGPRTSPLVGFHIAYYGEYARCNALGLEDTFEVSRDDIDTDMTAQQYHTDHDEPAAPVDYLSPAYGSACFRMFREEVPQNLYHWTRGFPRFYLRALDACRLGDLPVVAWYPSACPKPGWLRFASKWLLEPLTAAGPWLFALGVCVSLLRPGPRWRSLCLAMFSVFHAAVLLLVLPEFKHAGPLILPLTVFGGVGLASLGGLLHPGRLAAAAFEARRPALWLAGATAAVVAIWGLACAGAYEYSLKCRRELLAAVTALTASGQPAPETLRDPQLFSATLPPDSGAAPVGYLLRINAGPDQSFLECRRLHHDHLPCPGGVFITRHRLHPNQEQCFFVTCHPGTAFGDLRPFVCTALLDGEARFLSCTRVDLADWRRLPLATVFVVGECDPGNPVVGGTTAITHYAENPDLNTIGLTFDEQIRHGTLPAVALFPSEGEASKRQPALAGQGWRPIAGYSHTEPISGGMRVRTYEAPGAYAAETPLLTAPADGIYTFRLRYRPEAGKLTLGALAQDRQSWLAIQTADDALGAEALRFLRVKLHTGQVFSLVTANGAAKSGESSVFVLEELAAFRNASGD